VLLDESAKIIILRFLRFNATGMKEIENVMAVLELLLLKTVLMNIFVNISNIVFRGGISKARIHQGQLSGD